MQILKSINLNPELWQVGCLSDQCHHCLPRLWSCCLAGFCCPVCTLYKLRYDYLRGDMKQYLCCQGLFPGCACARPGRMGEKSCPELCLVLEACVCPGLSISATRAAMMTSYPHLILNFGIA